MNNPPDGDKPHNSEWAGARRSVTPESAAAGPGAPPAGAAATLLSIEDLVKDFPVTKGVVLQRRIGSVSAVASVSLAVPRGQTFGLVGESGCGKTTLGRLVVGLEVPTSGVIRFGGRDLSRSSGREYRRQRQQIQFMFRDVQGGQREPRPGA